MKKPDGNSFFCSFLFPLLPSFSFSLHFPTPNPKIRFSLSLSSRACPLMHPNFIKTFVLPTPFKMGTGEAAVFKWRPDLRACFFFSSLRERDETEMSGFFFGFWEERKRKKKKGPKRLPPLPRCFCSPLGSSSSPPPSHSNKKNTQNAKNRKKRCSFEREGKKT